MSQVKIVGLCGVARSGKDSFYKHSKHILKSRGITPRRFAFADSLKSECDQLLTRYTKISAFTSDNKEKETIRPFLVAWGTDVRRKLDEECWIKKIEQEVESSIDCELLPIITDVRYPNEADWVHGLGGIIIHISRTGMHPANKEEAKNDPILKEKSDLTVRWQTLGEDSEAYKDNIRKTIKDINLSQTENE
jgi:hypothetical protein